MKDATPHTPTPDSAGAEKLMAEKDDQEGRAGTAAAKMGQQVEPGACKQGALVLINDI